MGRAGAGQGTRWRGRRCWPPRARLRRARHAQPLGQRREARSLSRVTSRRAGQPGYTPSSVPGPLAGIQARPQMASGPGALAIALGRPVARHGRCRRAGSPRL